MNTILLLYFSKGEKTMKQQAARNHDIYVLYVCQHLTLQEIADMYSLSRGRVHQIVNIEIEKRRKQSYDDRMSLFDRMRYFEAKKDIFRDHTKALNSSLNCLARDYFGNLRFAETDISFREVQDFLNWFLGLDHEKLIDIRGIGVRKVWILSEIQRDILNNNAIYNKLIYNCDQIR